MATSSTAATIPKDALGYPLLIADGDVVIISGGGLNKCITVKQKTQMKLGRCGNVAIGSLVGKRYGDVFAFDEKTKTLVPTLETPELDRTEVNVETAAEEGKDNRGLFDTHGANQNLSHEEIIALRQSVGVENVVQTLVENSATFESKTAFAQEKYVRKKKAKYIVKFKVERVNPDNLCETIVPTLLVEADEDDDAKKRLPIRVDTMGLILHHANVSGKMRVMIHDRTNGLLPASILYRLGAEGQLLAVYDRTSMPATSFARSMHIPDWKSRWKAIPASPQFFSGEELEGAPAEEHANSAASPTSPNAPAAEGAASSSTPAADPSATTTALTGKALNDKLFYFGANPNRGPSQWVRGLDGHKMLADSPADSLIVAGFEDEIVPVVKKLFPFLSLSGNLVVYCPFIEPLERVYALIRDEAVCISISDTWYRHQQVLPGRTHPQVNMSTAGGFILTAVKVEHANSGSSNITRVGASVVEALAKTLANKKREREEDVQLSRAEAEKEAEAVVAADETAAAARPTRPY